MRRAQCALRRRGIHSEKEYPLIGNEGGDLYFQVLRGLLFRPRKTASIQGCPKGHIARKVVSIIKLIATIQVDVAYHIT